MDKKVYEYITKQSWEKIMQWKKCSCWEEFPITDKDIAFYEKISPTFPSPDSAESGLTRYLIPTPNLCPDCRQQRRLSFRNERKLYKRKCDLSGKDIISLYSPDKTYKVYEQSEWWSDKWDPLKYWKDFDFSRSFFEQFDELMQVVPRIALNAWNDNENCDYNNYISGSKNCYLNFWISNSENTLYSMQSSSITDSLEVYNSSNVRNSWYVEYSSTITNSLFVWNSNNIVESLFIKWCENVTNWMFCANISNQKYVFKNKEISKDEFEKKLEEVKKVLKLKNWLDILTREFEQFLKDNFPVKNLNNSNVENSFWNNLSGVKDCKFCFSTDNSSSSNYIADVFWINDCWDCNLIWNWASNLFDVINVFWSSNVYFSESVFEGSNNIFYSQNCTNWSSDLFWCIWLKSKKYCILNKQYTKEEYETLVPKIIEHMKIKNEWWEFFPSSTSPFWYNETLADEYYPATIKTGLNSSRPVFKISTYENPKPEVSKIIPASKLPDDIFSIPDDILNWAIECETSNKLFRITKIELAFYRKHGLPIPKKHPDIRHLDRMNNRAKRELFIRNCDKCWVEMVSVYNKDSNLNVFCEACYNEEIY